MNMECGSKGRFDLSLLLLLLPSNMKEMPTLDKRPHRQREVRDLNSFKKEESDEVGPGETLKRKDEPSSIVEKNKASWNGLK